MSARDNIGQLLQHWYQLSQEEGAAIQSAAWPALKKIQVEKALMQKSLTEATLQWAAENPTNHPDCPLTNPFRDAVARLISMATRNGDALTAQLRRARAEQELLEQAHKNLRSIERSYVQKRPTAAWHSYS